MREAKGEQSQAISCIEQGKFHGRNALEVGHGNTVRNSTSSCD